MTRATLVRDCGREEDHRRESCKGLDQDVGSLRVRIGDQDLTVTAQQLDDGFLDHGYALTVHQAQGLTVDRALLLGSGSLHAGVVAGGSEFSTYPDRCLLQGERRTVPGESLFQVESELQGLLVLSLDLRSGRVLSPQPELQRLGAPEALARLGRSGVREAIVLDLARVGSGEGPDLGLVGELHGRFPQLALLAGGGVRDAADLRALAQAGAAGALVATALHNGAIGRDDLTG